MKKLFFGLLTGLLLTAFVIPVTAAPFLVADPQPDDAVRWYKVTDAATGESFVTDYGRRHESGAMIVFDFAEHPFPPGEVAIEVRAVNVAGESAPLPFVFTMPSGVPQLPTNGALTP